MLLAEVALPVPLARAFTYEVPSSMVERLAPGIRVVCPFGSRKLVGVLLAVRDAEPPAGVKRLVSVIDSAPVMNAELLSFLREVATYYLAPIGEVLRLALPPVTKQEVRAVAEPSLFAPRGCGVAERRITWVVPTEACDEAHALRGQAAAILAHARAAGSMPLFKLRERWGNARAAVSKLSSLGLVRTEEREAPHDPYFREPVPRDTPPEATAAQREAIAAICAALGAAESRTVLLHGVTGSGKTEVYLRVIASARENKKGSLVLVPEIALTPQLVSRFRARFGDDVAVIHSALTPRERFTMWQRLHRGELDVAIGARSVLFAPVRSLGLVIVDEEHDSSFKQEEGVRYHARDMAILRAYRGGAICVLGSATPSLESEQLVRSGRALKLALPDRAGARPLPSVEIIDLRRIGPGPTGDKRISLPLHRALEAALALRQQAILFLNRRGFAPSVRCEACGQHCGCPLCSVALTFHKRAGAVLRCHYCEFEAATPAVCPNCKKRALVLEGLGTEKLEETLTGAFPSARIARLDRDVASGKMVERVLARVRAREIDILVGTQMVTKGHDLPSVTLVGVINADAALSIPDFRASERAFQLLVQVAGRAGRGDTPGRVFVQTYNPDHPAIVFAAKHDVAGFLAHELADRRELGYPPYSRVALVRVDAQQEDAARAAAGELARIARAHAGDGPVHVVGPAPAPIARIRNRFRFRVMLRASDRTLLRSTLRELDRARSALPRSVRCVLDIDPVQLL